MPHIWVQFENVYGVWGRRLAMTSRAIVEIVTSLWPFVEFGLGIWGFTQATYDNSTMCDNWMLVYAWISVFKWSFIVQKSVHYSSVPYGYHFAHLLTFGCIIHGMVIMDSCDSNVMNTIIKVQGIGMFSTSVVINYAYVWFPPWLTRLPHVHPLECDSTRLEYEPLIV